MGVVRCIRCDSYIDLDYNVEVFTNDQIPGLTKDNFDWVCFECLTDDEAEILEDNALHDYLRTRNAEPKPDASQNNNLK